MNRSTITSTALLSALVLCLAGCETTDKNTQPDHGSTDQSVDSTYLDSSFQQEDGSFADAGVDLAADLQEFADEGSVDTTPVFTLTSSAFADGEPIPLDYSCHADPPISPPLAWNNVPADTQSYALLVEDPDAGTEPFVHWVLFNIPAARSELAADSADVGTLGTNSGNYAGYAGPCPTSGLHHYVFTLYALSTTGLDLVPGASIAEFRAAIENFILGQAQLTGTYEALAL